MVKVGQTHRRLDAGEASRGGEPRVLPTGLGLARGAQLRDADARPHPTVVVARPGSGRSGAGDELGGGRSSGASGMGLRCANERGEVPRRLYAMRGARWAHARDQMVTGASPATSAAAAKVRPWRGYSVESGRDQGRRGRRCGCSQRVRWRRRRGRGRSGCCESTTTAVGAEDEGNNDDGAAGRSGVVCLSEDEEQVMAELLDRSRGRGGGDSRGGARR